MTDNRALINDKFGGSAAASTQSVSESPFECADISLNDVPFSGSANHLVTTHNIIPTCTSHAILAAEKRSSEIALALSEINADRNLKRMRMETQFLENQKSDLSKKIRQLERQLAESQSETENAKHKLEQIERNSRVFADNTFQSQAREECLNQKIDKLENEIVGLKSLLQQKANESSQISSLKAELTANERKYNDLKRARNDEAECMTRYESLRERLLELEEENSSLKDSAEIISHGPGNNSSLISRPDGSGLYLRSSSLLRATRLEQRVAKLTTENTNLRRSEAALACAQAEIEDLNARLAQANVWRERALLAEEKNSRMTTEHADGAGESTDNQRAFGQSQQESAILLAEQGQLRSELLAKTAQLSIERQHVGELTEECRRHQSNIQCLELRCRKQSRRLTILQQERDMYKRFVSSYEDADATLASPAGNLVHEFQDLISSIADSIDSFYQQADLEHNELECLRAIIVGGGGNGSRKSDASLAAVFTDDAIASVDRQQIVPQLRKQVAELKVISDSLEAEKANLQQELDCMRARGAWNQDETQILHLLANPADAARRSQHEELVNLRKENARLQQRAAILQDRLTRLYETRSSSATVNNGGTDEALAGPTDLGGVTRGNLTMAVQDCLDGHPDPISEIEKLKSKLKAEKWRGDRLMETFSSASTEFREACALLFGYSLQIRQPGVYKVCLNKQIGDATGTATKYLKYKRCDDSLQLMETTFRGNVMDDIIHASNLSVPVVMARLLLHLTGGSTGYGVNSEGVTEQSTMLM